MDADRLAKAQAQAVQSNGQAFAAHISRIATDGTYAVAPSLSTVYEYGPVRFTGENSLAEGDGCLLVLDEAAGPWVVSAPTLPPVPPSPWDPGDLKTTARASAPAGWLLCDGTAVSRTTYAVLFAAIGATYGVGDGSTTFNLPTLAGRSPVGAGTAVGASGATAKALGAKGGEETHLLSVTEMPSHNHGGATGSMNRNNPHAHGTNLAQGLGAGGYDGNWIQMAGPSGGAAGSGYGGIVSTNIDHEHAISAQGGGSAANNMMPFTVVNYIIKT